MKNTLSEFGSKLSRSDYNNNRDDCESFLPIEDNKISDNDPVQWICLGDGKFVSSNKSVRELPTGAYIIKHDPRRDIPLFEKKDIRVDKLIFSENNLAHKILNEMEDFWKKRSEYSKIGYLHRRGFLLYGPQGSGKTSIVQQSVYNVLKKGGIVFICEHPTNFADGLSLFRKIEPNRDIICLFEDIDAIKNRYGEDKLLSILDGENQIDHVFNLATTNYPETLDRRIVSRPRRFDRVIKVFPPDEETRRSYFKEKLKKENINNWVKATNGLSFAAIAELIISVKCLGEPFNDTVKRLQEMAEKTPSSEETDSSIGFSG